MPSRTSSQGRVSRETRQLLVAAFVALVALWVLARIRFPDQPSTPNPIPSLLQLSTAPRFANLAGEIAELQDRLAGTWLTVPASRVSGETGETIVRVLPAMRFRDDAAVALVPRGDRLQAGNVVAADRATGLTVLRTEADVPARSVMPWVPPSLDTPRYFMAALGTPIGVSLRPVLVSSLRETRSAGWPGPVWAAPDGTDLDAGSFVFSTNGELAGMVIQEATGPVIVPWDVVIAEAGRLMKDPGPNVVNVGVEVQSLTRALAEATGANTGVVVAWVDPKGPAATHLQVGDVIEALHGQPIFERRDWEVASSRLTPGNTDLRVRRQHKIVNVEITLPPASAPAGQPELGLTMSNTRDGASVVRVAPMSAAAAANLREGDLITLAGEVRQPRAADVEESFAALPEGKAMMLAVTRGDAHLVVALVK